MEDVIDKDLPAHETEGPSNHDTEGSSTQDTAGPSTQEAETSSLTSSDKHRKVREQADARYRLNAERMCLKL